MLRLAEPIGTEVLAVEIVVSHQSEPVPVVLFHITGEISADSSHLLELQGEEAVKDGACNLLLDLSDVTFVSSSGLRAVHHLFTLLRDASSGESDEVVRKGLLAGTYRSPHLKLLNPSRDALQTLKLAGFDMFLEIHSDLRTALASF
jgi:anti-anti-sigma factor